MAKKDPLKLKLASNLKGKGKMVHDPKGAFKNKLKRKAMRSAKSLLPSVSSKKGNSGKGRSVRDALKKAKKKNPAKIAKKAALAGKGAVLAGKGGIIGMVGGGLAYAGHTVATVLTAFFSGIFGFFGAIIGAIATFFTTIFGVIAGIIITIVTVIATIVMFIIAVIAAVLVATLPPPLQPCVQEVLSYVNDMTDQGTVDIKGSKLEVGTKIYSYFKDYGYTYNQIVGVIANADAESNLDPTCVETVYNEPYQIGNRKNEYQELEFKRSKILSTPLVYSNESIIRGYLNTYPSIKTIGIGCFQMTNTETEDAGRATNLINFAKSQGKNWYDLDAQLAFMTNENSGDGRYNFISSEYPSMKDASAADCMIAFRSKYEGNNTLGYESASKAVAEWELLEPVLQYDGSFSDSVIAMSNNTVNVVGNNTANNLGEDDECAAINKSAYGDNSTIALAAASIAHTSEEKAKKNNGTNTYQAVHDAVIPGDTIYQSCDRVVCSAVRWSGADDNFPEGNVMSQYSYLSTHPDKWEDVTGSVKGESGRIDKTKLQPGDICLTRQVDPKTGHGHIIVYTGNEALKQIHNEAVKDTDLIVSGSFEERSAGAGPWWDSSYGDYSVYRVKGYDANSVYKTALTIDELSLTSDELDFGFGGVTVDGTASAIGARVATNAKANNSSHPATYGWCAAWVGGVYERSGVGRTRGDAIEYWTKWGNPSQAYLGTTTKIPIGAAVIFAPSGANGGYGHIGIYVGGGMIAHNGGGVRVEPIDVVAKWTGGACLGYVYPFGNPAKLGY